MLGGVGRDSEATLWLLRSDDGLPGFTSGKTLVVSADMFRIV